MADWYRSVTLEELRVRAEHVARLTGYADVATAFRALDAGDLDGTLLEAELRSIRFLERGGDRRDGCQNDT